LKNRIVLIMRANPDVRLVINDFCKPLITSRKSIAHLSNAEFELKWIEKEIFQRAMSIDNTDWIFVIVQLHWPKRLSSRSFGSILILKKSRFSGIPKYVGLIYKSIWYNLAELHPTKSQYVDYQIFENILFRDNLSFNTTNS